MRIRVNGKDEAAAEKLTVLAYLQQKGVRPETVAVEFNGEIIPKDAYAGTLLSDGATLEIVKFVGGGAR